MSSATHSTLTTALVDITEKAPPRRFAMALFSYCSLSMKMNFPPLALAMFFISFESWSLPKPIVWIVNLGLLL